MSINRGLLGQRMYHPKKVDVRQLAQRMIQNEKCGRLFGQLCIVVLHVAQALHLTLIHVLQPGRTRVILRSLSPWISNKPSRLNPSIILT